eukprot:4332298-Amphidinium_carterae.1
MKSGTVRNPKAGSARMINQALALFHDMGIVAASRDVVTYNTTISACEKAAQWPLALYLLNYMELQKCIPTVVIAN